MLIQSLIATLFISLLSLTGALFLLKKNVGHQKNIAYFVSFAAGVMLAAALLDLLPHAIEKADPHEILTITLWGIVGSFLFERFLLWHHHHDDKHFMKPSAFLVLAGDAVHNFVDGIVIAAAFLVDPTLGILTTIAIVAHELPQELADFSVLLYTGLSRQKALLFNFLSATTAIIGTFTGYFFLEAYEQFLPSILAFTTGMFIYIACADLIPELHRERHENRTNQILQVFPFIIGVILMAILTSFEVGH